MAHFSKSIMPLVLCTKEGCFDDGVKLVCFERQAIVMKKGKGCMHVVGMHDPVLVYFHS